MPATLGVILSENNAVRAKPEPRVGLVLLERTFYDPPRKAAMERWTAMVRRSFPSARLVPYAWHLVSHAPEDGVRGHGTRTLSGEPHRFGGLQDSPETAQAWDVTAIAVAVCGDGLLAVRTPLSLSPGALGRRRLQAFVAARKAEGLDVIWEPSGLWEPPEALAFGRSVGAHVLLPAFEGGRPRYESDTSTTLLGADAWLHVAPHGSRQTLNPGQVDAVADHVADHPDATIIVSGRRALAAIRSLADVVP